MPDVREVLAAIKARAAAATLGPWAADQDSPAAFPFVWASESADTYAADDALHIAQVFRDDDDPLDDARFIAAARSDVPRLVAAVEAVLDDDARASAAERPREGICRTCLAPIWREVGTVGHIEREGWSDRIERGGDSLVCFKAIEYRHVVTTPVAPQQPGHAPGWKWRKDFAGRLATPWGIPAHLGGICELGWHGDCPQAPNPPAGGFGTCSCECHQQGPLTLFGLDELAS